MDFTVWGISFLLLQAFVQWLSDIGDAPFKICISIRQQKWYRYRQRLHKNKGIIYFSNKNNLVALAVF
jgi:hypothetical protein